MSPRSIADIVERRTPVIRKRIEIAVERLVESRLPAAERFVASTS